MARLLSFLSLLDLLNLCIIIIGVVIIFRWSNVLYYLRYTSLRGSSIFWIKITLHRDEEKKKEYGGWILSIEGVLKLTKE